MRLVPTTLAAAVLAFTLGAVQAAQPTDVQTKIAQSSIDHATQLRERALNDDTGYKVVESLTTEVGPRMAGSEADARAVAWAVAKFKALGYDKVWTEPVTFPKWVRTSEHAQVLGDHAQPLTLTALVDGIVMPVVALVTGGASVADWKYVVTPAELDAAGKQVAAEVAFRYGLVLQTLIDFLLIAFVIFLFLKAYNRLRATEPAAAPPEDVLLLREIRDSLKRPA